MSCVCVCLRQPLSVPSPPFLPPRPRNRGGRERRAEQSRSKVSKVPIVVICRSPQKSMAVHLIQARSPAEIPTFRPYHHITPTFLTILNLELLAAITNLRVCLNEPYCHGHGRHTPA